MKVALIIVACLIGVGLAYIGLSHGLDYMSAHWETG